MNAPARTPEMPSAPVRSDRPAPPLPLRPRRPLVPIRWRLTIWYAALLTLTVSLLGTGLYLGLRYRLYAGFDEQLRNQAAVTLAGVQIDEDGRLSLAGAPADAEDADYFVRLLGSDGEIILDTGFDGEPVPFNPRMAATALAGSRRYDTVTADDETLRVLTMPVRDGEQVVGALQIGLDRGDLDETLGELLSALALIVPIALVVAAAVGYVVAGRALAPVATITSLAARIGGKDLGARLNLLLPDDEVGRLARTFDGMLARIEESFERQRRFTGDAAHELRTPLSLMRSRLDVTLSHRRTPEEYEAAMLELGTDLERMTGLVGTLLMLARADSGRLVAERASLDLQDPIRFVAEQFRPLAEESGISLENRTEPALVEADHDLIVQVLVNLVTNALAHTAAGGAIELGCRGAGGTALLWVSDTGEGIAPEHQARVLDRFYRVDTGRTRARGGSGLGLAICKAIAEAHGGTISLRSAVGVGATVELRLPRHLGP